MKTLIHVNQHVIKRNAKHDERAPPLTVKDYQQNRKAHTAEIIGADGDVVARVIHRPDDPLPCGARVWIETDLEVKTHG